ncbi:hypothetical protein HYALB_00006320 [Hymenoscyphus albidus]|uniref:Uncharacterized protein n=1 Tax=Hymenoscyphus albidus TaxID=595503 RepID=A0A9N9LEB4_9HELO|nr:hypothetical protein HYALB_00006320 [Hymenoscyphus albidus]
MGQVLSSSTTRPGEIQTTAFESDMSSSESDFADYQPAEDQPKVPLEWLLLEFIQVTFQHPAYKDNRIFAHSTVVHAYIIALTLQATTVPSIHPKKRMIALRDLAVRLNLKVKPRSNLKKDAFTSLTTLCEFIRKTLKDEMKWLEGKEAERVNRPSNQIGGLFHYGTEPASNLIRRAARLSYRSGIELERVEKIVREIIESSELEGVEEVAPDDFPSCLPQLLLQRVPEPNDIPTSLEMDENRAKASLAILEYRERLKVSSEELLKRMTTDTSTKRLQGGVDLLWGIQDAHKELIGKLEALLNTENQEDDKVADVD